MGAQRRPQPSHRLGRAPRRPCSSPLQSILMWDSVLSPTLRARPLPLVLGLAAGVNGHSCVTWSEWSEETHLSAGLWAQPQGADLGHLLPSASYLRSLGFLQEGEGSQLGGGLQPQLRYQP